MSSTITMIDYGASNIRSAQKAFEHIGANVQLTNDPDVVRKADKLVLPGVGAFGSGMDGLRQHDLPSAIHEAVGRGVPFLGICVGMQLMFDEGHEMGVHEGLGLMAGKVIRFPERLAISNEPLAVSNDSGASSNDSEALSNGSGAVRNDSEASSNDSGAIRNGSGALSNNSGAVRNDSGALSNSSEALSNDSGASSSEPNSSRITHHASLKIPHMGWNQLEPAWENPLLNGVRLGDYVYFVHSYYCDPDDATAVLAWTDYGLPFASVVAKDNVYGLQFHPEKSQSVGLKILQNFVKI